MVKELESRSKKSPAMYKKLGHRSKKSPCCAAMGRKLGHRSKKRGKQLSKKREGMKKEWPPLKDCPQYRRGLITDYLKKRPYENKEYDIDAEGIYFSDDNKNRVGRRPHYYKHSDIKKFLHQVRSSRGYDVDENPPPRVLNSPFMPQEPKTSSLYNNENGQPSYMANLVTKMLRKHIKSKTGKVYNYVETLKLVYSMIGVLLLTFTAKEDVDDAPLETFLATVFAPAPARPNKHRYEVLECFLKPDGPAPTE